MRPATTRCAARTSPSTAPSSLMTSMPAFSPSTQRTAHGAVDAESAGEGDVADDGAAAADEAGDLFLIGLFAEHVELPACYVRGNVCCVWGWPPATMRTSTERATAPCGKVKVPSIRW